MDKKNKRLVIVIEQIEIDGKFAIRSLTSANQFITEKEVIELVAGYLADVEGNLKDGHS